MHVEDPTKNKEIWVPSPLLPVVVWRLREQWSYLPEGPELRALSRPPGEEDVTSALISIDGAIGGRPPKEEKPCKDKPRKEGVNMTHTNRPAGLGPVGDEL